MKKRSRISRGKSRRLFQRASVPHPKNTRPAPMRGGIRL